MQYEYSYEWCTCRVPKSLNLLESKMSHDFKISVHGVLFEIHISNTVVFKTTFRTILLIFWSLTPQGYAELQADLSTEYAMGAALATG